MATYQQFTRDEVLRIVGITPRQLGHWERLRLIEPHSTAPDTAYTFNDLISLRTVKQLTDQRLEPRRLRQTLDAAERQWSDIQSPLTELRVVVDGRRIVVEHDGAMLDPSSGQFLLNFRPSALGEKVRSLPGFSRGKRGTEQDWFETALEYEESPEQSSQAIEAYRRVIERSPDWVEPRLNLGTLLYEQGERAEATEHFRKAVALAPRNPLAHFDLGSVLEDIGELEAARRHLTEAVRLKPDYADAHYNLARVSDKLGAHLEARQHWLCYLDLDPQSPWATFARQQLGSHCSS